MKIKFKSFKAKFGFWCSENATIGARSKYFLMDFTALFFLLPFGVTGAKKYLKLNFFSYTVRPSPFFSFSVECVFWYWVGRSDWKKKTHKNSRNSRPWYPRIGRRQKLTFTYLDWQNVRVVVPVVLCAVTICSFFILKELFQVKNGLTTSLPFFWKCQKFGLFGRR